MRSQRESALFRYEGDLSYLRNWNPSPGEESINHPNSSPANGAIITKAIGVVFRLTIFKNLILLKKKES